MVWCSTCSKGIPTAFSCNVLGTTHLKIGLSAFLLNDQYSGKNNNYSNSQAFQIFCEQCYNNGHYHKKIIEKYPQILQKYASKQYKQLFLNHQNMKQQHKLQLESAFEEIKKINSQLQKYNTIEGIYNRFQFHYKADNNKIQSLQTFKMFGKQITLKDPQFKNRFTDFFAKIEKAYVNKSIMQIQRLFRGYLHRIDQRIKLCENDIIKIRQIQRKTVGTCQSEVSEFNKLILINASGTQQVKKIFNNQINYYQNLQTELIKIKKKGIIEMDESEFPANHSFQDISDAQMHQKYEW